LLHVEVESDDFYSTNHFSEERMKERKKERKKEEADRRADN
jgi:hypothetical protein